jgi:type II secretory pathway component PulF
VPIFKYIAKNKSGENIRGKVEAASKIQAVSTLFSRDLFVIDVSTLGQETGFLSKIFKPKVKFAELVNFTRQLATMINAGLPLASALSILEEEGESEMTKLTANLLKDVESGLSFSDSLQKYPDNFSRIYVQLVRAGEAGGVLDEVLERLAITLEKEKDFKAKTKSAMIYPIIILIAMVAVGAVMMIAVIPKLTEMYDDFGADLPVMTRSLMAVSGFMVKFWWLMLLLGIAAGAALRSYRKTKKGELLIDRWLLKLPIFGKMRQKIILTDFTRTLSLLLGAGVSLLESINIVADAIDNAVYREELAEAAKEVERGTSLSSAVSRYEDFPSILHQMMSVGEETGKIDEILEKLAEYFEKESEYAVKNMTTAMEPLIMIVLAVGVGFMVVAIIMPIYSLTSQF